MAPAEERPGSEAKLQEDLPAKQQAEARPASPPVERASPKSGEKKEVKASHRASADPATSPQRQMEHGADAGGHPRAPDGRQPRRRQDEVAGDEADRVVESERQTAQQDGESGEENGWSGERVGTGGSRTPRRDPSRERDPHPARSGCAANLPQDPAGDRSESDPQSAAVKTASGAAHGESPAYTPRRGQVSPNCPERSFIQPQPAQPSWQGVRDCISPRIAHIDCSAVFLCSLNIGNLLSQLM